MNGYALLLGQLDSGARPAIHLALWIPDREPAPYGRHAKFDDDVDVQPVPVG